MLLRWNTCGVRETNAVRAGPVPGTGYGRRRVVVATDLADPHEREEVHRLVLLGAVSGADLEQ